MAEHAGNSCRVIRRPINSRGPEHADNIGRIQGDIHAVADAVHEAIVAFGGKGGQFSRPKAVTITGVLLPANLP